jgi:hypothetical protein
MTVTPLTDNELDQKVKILYCRENATLQEVLKHVSEVDQRKLHLKMGFASLFDYLTKHIGYSVGSAQRRIDAARLSQKVPELLPLVKAGSINLAQISKMQKLCRAVKKESGLAVPSSVQKEVLAKLLKQGAAQTDLILAQEFNVSPQVADKRSTQRDESVRVELTFTKEEMAILDWARQQLSNKTGGGLKDTILALAKLAVAEPKVKVQNPNATVVANRPESAPASSAAPAPTTAPLRKTVTPKLRREIIARDQCCQFRDPETGRVCGSQFFLEVDHIRRRFLNGSHAAENLRVLCKNHNSFRYQAGLDEACD